MKTLYLSYDINKKNDYSQLYSFIEEHGGEEISESTYVFRTEMSFIDFCEELTNVTARGDLVVVIFKTITGISHLILRGNRAQLSLLGLKRTLSSHR